MTGLTAGGLLLEKTYRLGWLTTSPAVYQTNRLKNQEVRGGSSESTKTDHLKW